MKKFLSAFLCFMLVFNTAIAFGWEVSQDTDSYYSGYAQQLNAAYQNGAYGDELYYFIITGAFVNSLTILVTVKDGIATLVYTENNGERVHTRELTADEYQSLTGYMAENNVDSLPDWNTRMIFDGIEYHLTHITPSGVSYVYINNPDSESYPAGSVYVGLADLFRSFINSGEFELSHSSGAKILVPKEEYNVRAVWKEGDDFRVCVEVNGGLQWQSFKDGVVGEIVAEPEGITLVDAWSDYPSSLGTNHLNTYPWQCGWNNYRVRCSIGGLWLGQAGQMPIKFDLSGAYSHPIVIPGTNFAVCRRAASGRWTDLKDIVKIDLVTGEETVLDFEPAGSICPVAMIGSELLVFREWERYLWNPETDEIRAVSGDFKGLGSLTYRFLQKADGENLYYTVAASYEKWSTAVGVIDTEKFEFTPMFDFDDIYITEPSDIWVDGDTVYAVQNGDLLELPFDLGKPCALPTKVRVNGRKVEFRERPITDNGRIYVCSSIYDPLGIEGSYVYETNSRVLCRGKKILTLSAGTDYITELDISGFDSIESLKADLAGSDIHEKDYCKTIPLETTVKANYIPLRAVCEAFGGEVVWNGEENCVDVIIDNSGMENLFSDEIAALMDILLGR